MAKISFRSKEKPLKKFEKRLESLSKAISSFEKKIEKMDSRIDKLIDSIDTNGIVKSIQSSRTAKNRAKTEQFTEQIEQYERPLGLVKPDGLGRIRGRHREILAMLINNGFHTYKQIAKNLNISQSRARAYIAELKNEYKVPLRHVRDPEGYKVGIDARFIEEILLEGNKLRR